MKKIKVKITGHSFEDTCWYANQIGNIITVWPDGDEDFLFWQESPSQTWIIKKSDCEVIEEPPTFHDGIYEGFEAGMMYDGGNSKYIKITWEEYKMLKENQKDPETTSQPEPFDLERALKGDKFTWNEKPGTYCVIGKSPNGYQLGHGCKYVVEQVDWKGDIYLWRETADELSKYTMAPKEPEYAEGYVIVFEDGFGAHVFINEQVAREVAKETHPGRTFQVRKIKLPKP